MKTAPLVLGFDTSGPWCAAAVVRGDEVLSVRAEDMARGQAERLMVLLEEVLRDAGLGWSDPSRIGVGIGPGNFTGIRIAVSAARGLALGLGIPAVGVSLLETTRWLGQRAQTAVPAPREQYYFMDFDKMQEPALVSTRPEPVTLSTEFAPAFHAEMIARRAAVRTISGESRPAPLYVKPPDAAPARDTPPRIIP